ncbi:MAG: hypothetical protein ABSH49_08645 [Bryobacteraceae bacterium]|jgi:hypothetical protein
MLAPRLFLSIAIICGVAAAQDWPNLTGAWTLDTAHSPAGRVKSQSLSIQQTEETIEITDAVTDANGKDYKSVFHCNIDGNQCKVKDQGQNAMLTFYYHGLVLVMMETKRDGAYVIRKHLTLSEDGKTMSVELEHLNPAGAKETYVYNKQ